MPLEYQVLGYEPEPFPGLTPYAPPLLEQPLMAGAAEEEPDSAPSSVIQPLDKLPTLPDSVHQMPYVILEIGNRWVLDCGVEWQADAVHRKHRCRLGQGRLLRHCCRL